MVSFTQLTAAATAVLGYDIMAGKDAGRHKTSNRNRVITAIGCAGSAAAGDASVDLYVGIENCGTFFNSTGGASKIPSSNADMRPLRVFVPAGAPISLVVSDAPATEILAVTLEYA